MARLGGIANQTTIGGAGTQLRDLTSTKVTLAALLIDKSSSTGNVNDAIREGQNAGLRDLRGFPKKKAVLVAQYLFDDDYRELHPFVAVDQAALLDGNNYRSGGCTLLYKTVLDVVAATEKMAAEWRAKGFTVDVLYGIFTDADGDNQSGSRGVTPADLHRVVTDALATERSRFFYIGMGGTTLDIHRQTAQMIGIPDDCIKAADHTTPADELGRWIRQQFGLFSSSVKAASQSAAGVKDPSVDDIWQ